MSPLRELNSQGSFANAEDDEAEMVSQGLCGSIETALEWRTDEPWRCSAAATIDMTLVQILGELVHPSGKAAWEKSTT